jgi:hypothetical protein
MAYTTQTIPYNYMAGYSAVPMKVFESNWKNLENFDYIFNLTWAGQPIGGSSQYYIGENLFTRIFVTETRLFSAGDTVVIIDDNQINNGYYTIMKILNSTSMVINKTPNLNNDFTPADFNTVFKVIKYKVKPDEDGYGKIDFSNVLKDFVTENLTGQTNNYALTYTGENTKFEYGITAGFSSRYRQEFVDNFFSGGSVGFYNTSITGTTGIPFQIGDLINVEQDLAYWEYNDNYADGDYVGFTGSTPHNFRVGQQITITGQITNPSYNGRCSIVSVLPNAIVVDKLFGVSSPAEPGLVWGVPRPEYNGVATITQIFIDPTLGLCIITDKPFTDPSQVIGGFISYADNRITEIIDNNYIAGLYVYNARINNNQYSLQAFDKYVIQNRSAGLNYISTTLNSFDKYRIEPSTIGFLLSHHTTNFATGFVYRFYQNSTLLGRVYIAAPTDNKKDFYMPIGIKQVSQCITNQSGSFSGYSGNVTNYEVFAGTSGYTQRSNAVLFEINNDCSKYELYHLMWKDKLGSFISYPFKYISRDFKEVERKDYYQIESNWDNNTFGYRDYDRGQKDFYTKSRKSLILNSGWLYEFERTLIEDLIDSPSVYVQTPDNRIYGCKLGENKIEIYKDINEDLFQYSFNVIVSQNEYRF